MKDKILLEKIINDVRNWLYASTIAEKQGIDKKVVYTTLTFYRKTTWDNIALNKIPYKKTEKMVKKLCSEWKSIEEVQKITGLAKKTIISYWYSKTKNIKGYNKKWLIGYNSNYHDSTDKSKIIHALYALKKKFYNWKEEVIEKYNEYLARQGDYMKEFWKDAIFKITEDFKNDLQKTW